MLVCVCNIKQYDSLWLLAASLLYLFFLPSCPSILASELPWIPTSLSYQLYPLSRDFPPFHMVPFHLPVLGFLSVCSGYVLLPLLNKESYLAYGRVE